MAASEEAALVRVRAWVGAQFLRGEGIEIGALHEPLPIPAVARVRYVDRLPVDELRRQYPELDGKPLVPVDWLDDAETLTRVPDASQDFVIANHLLEHCQDPIGALANFLRVLRPGGVLYLAVPDKRFTFDQARETTQIQHLVDDHQRGPARSRRQHFEEWVDAFLSAESAEVKAAEVERLLSMDYSIHFHCWTQVEFLELLIAVRRGLDLPFEIELVLANRHEVLAILRKHPRD
jgi:predicted SAM-dependent methyltransferase